MKGGFYPVLRDTRPGPSPAPARPRCSGLRRGRPNRRWSPRLPADPFHRHAERVGTTQAARDWRVSERRVRALKRQGSVQLATADRMATAWGTHLALLYPELA